MLYNSIYLGTQYFVKAFISPTLLVVFMKSPYPSEELSLRRLAMVRQRSRILVVDSTSNS